MDTSSTPISKKEAKAMRKMPAATDEEKGRLKHRQELNAQKFVASHEDRAREAKGRDSRDR